MDVKSIFEDKSYRLITGSSNTEVKSVEFDSRKITNGGLFIAVKGFTVDGHQYINKAIELGATTIVVDDNQDVFTESELKALGDEKGITVVSVPDSHEASAYIPQSFFGHPEEQVELIGVTGTKGKTTITFMLLDIMNKSNKPSGLIGTVCNVIGDERIHSIHTTPEARDTYELLGKMASKNLKACIMEVSSQGLKLGRVDGLKFGTGCFTNFYEDHIGGNEHPDMEDYLFCKLKLFERCENAVINLDTPVSDKVIAKARSCGCKIYTYGTSEGADIKAFNIVNSTIDGRAGTKFEICSPWYNGELFVAMPGLFNVYNAICALAAAFLSGADIAGIKDGLATIKVPGRLQHVHNDLGITILVDYAHNAASLENVLDTLKTCTEGRVISVFGCGGDRSHTRRYEMGEVSGNKSDYTIITSDNPRTENPDVIISHIVVGMEKTSGKYETVVDRREAIKKAISIANPGDIVLIAGKGHEDYQIFADRTIHFDDAEVALEAALEVKEERS
ncbi:MAG: UDP-N-acetylmuramoyl-L-alanyl-D-glutamate--2,6-diaminopimelate ligase [Saccharofermentans sp.]|nr:UDP-N-acetylmuramoyl-L-alanyl-D-glutamate--2,6-diaminopimelate ligase [Saccharofermentans sp.]